MKPKHANCLTFEVEEAGQVLGIGRTKAYEAARSGEIPTIRIGRRRLVPKALLYRMLEQASDKIPEVKDE